QRVRSHRNRGRLLRVRGNLRVDRRERADREADRQHAALRARPGLRAGWHRRAGRALYRRRRPRPRIPGAAGAIRGPIRAGSLAETLPGYMIPARYAVVASLPLTVNGKVDRKALAVMGLAQPAVASVAAPARSKLEASLAAIFAEAPGLETVGLRDDFFKLG